MQNTVLVVIAIANVSIRFFAAGLTAFVILDKTGMAYRANHLIHLKTTTETDFALLYFDFERRYPSKARCVSQRLPSQ